MFTTTRARMKIQSLPLTREERGLSRGALATNGLGGSCLLGSFHNMER